MQIRTPRGPGRSWRHKEFLSSALVLGFVSLELFKTWLSFSFLVLLGGLYMWEESLQKKLNLLFS